jgi:hypothetical protein
MNIVNTINITFLKPSLTYFLASRYLYADLVFTQDAYPLMIGNNINNRL